MLNPTVSLMNNSQNYKKILYRSLHRGCKETDILLGKFAEARLDKLSEKDFALYDDFIQEDDAEIYDWLLSTTPAKEEYRQLVLMIQQFHNL